MSDEGVSATVFGAVVVFTQRRQVRRRGGATGGVERDEVVGLTPLGRLPAAGCGAGLIAGEDEVGQFRRGLVLRPPQVQQSSGQRIADQSAEGGVCGDAAGLSSGDRPIPPQLARRPRSEQGIKGNGDLHVRPAPVELR